MIRIYIRPLSKGYGRVYKSHTSILKDKVKILGYINFCLTGYITQEEWAKSDQLISEKFGFYIQESYINGRSKIGRNTPYFNWEEVIKSNYKNKG